MFVIVVTRIESTPGRKPFEYAAAARQRHLHRAFHDLNVVDHRRLRHAVGLVSDECQRIDVFASSWLLVPLLKYTSAGPPLWLHVRVAPDGRQERQVAGRVARRGNGRHRIGLPHLLHEMPQHAVAVFQNVDVGFLGVPHGVAGSHHDDDRRHQRGHHRGGDHHFEQRQAAPPAVSCSLCCSYVTSLPILVVSMVRISAASSASSPSSSL